MIPATNFAVYIVMSDVHTEMGVYQTFEQALNRVSECLRTNKLVEQRTHDQYIRYSSEAHPSRYYDIYKAHFFYNKNLPLVTNCCYAFREEFEPDPRIVNK